MFGNNSTSLALTPLSTSLNLTATVSPALSSADYDQYGTPPTELSFLLLSASTDMEGMVGQLLDGNGTLVKADPAILIHTLRPHCGQHHVADFAKLLAESLAKKPVRECEWTRLVLTCIFCIVAMFGFIGNLLTVMVIFRTPSLHSHTNYFLASLAVSDLLLISVGVSFDLISLWRRNLLISGWTAFGGFCQTTSTAISWFTFCSILTIVGLTGERLVAICYPFSLRPYFYHGSMIWLTCILWVISFFPSLYIGLQFKRVVKDFCGRSHPNMLGSCDFVGWGDQNGEDHYTFEAQLLITFVFPVIFIIYSYIKILRALNEATSNSRHLHAMSQSRICTGARSNSQQIGSVRRAILDDSNPPSPDDANIVVGERRFFGVGGGDDNGSTRSKRSLMTPPPAAQSLARNSFGRNSTRSQQAQKTVMKMLVTITILFFICYLPYHLERLIVKYTREYCDQSRACMLLYPITGLLQYVSATLNPIIYNVMSRRFRREFLRLCHRMCGREMKADTTAYRGNNGGRIPLHMTPLNRLL